MDEVDSLLNDIKVDDLLFNDISTYNVDENVDENTNNNADLTINNNVDENEDKITIKFKNEVDMFNEKHKLSFTVTIEDTLKSYYSWCQYVNKVCQNNNLTKESITIKELKSLRRKILNYHTKINVNKTEDEDANLNKLHSKQTKLTNQNNIYGYNNNINNFNKNQFNNVTDDNNFENRINYKNNLLTVENYNLKLFARKLLDEIENNKKVFMDEYVKLMGNYKNLYNKYESLIDERIIKK